MSKDEFLAKYRGRLLLHLTEAWAIRKEPPSQVGLVLDAHARQLRQMLAEMYDDLQPAPAAEPFGARNGRPKEKESTQ